MTDKQKRLVEWIQDKTGVKYNPKENLSAYINEWRPKAEDIAEEERQMNLQLEIESEIMNGEIV